MTYLVFPVKGEQVLVGYFTLAIKPLSIKNKDSFSNNMRRRIMRTSELDEQSNTFSTAAYLIAQLGKNSSENLPVSIVGRDLLELAIIAIRELQYRAGGNIVFLEAEEHEKLLYSKTIKFAKLHAANVLP